MCILKWKFCFLKFNVRHLFIEVNNFCQSKEHIFSIQNNYVNESVGQRTVVYLMAMCEAQMHFLGSHLCSKGTPYVNAEEEDTLAIVLRFVLFISLWHLALVP